MLSTYNSIFLKQTPWYCLQILSSYFVFSLKFIVKKDNCENLHDEGLLWEWNFKSCNPILQVLEVALTLVCTGSNERIASFLALITDWIQSVFLSAVFLYKDKSFSAALCSCFSFSSKRTFSSITRGAYNLNDLYQWPSIL